MAATPPTEPVPPTGPTGNSFIQRVQVFARHRPIVAGVAALIAVCVVCGSCVGITQAMTGHTSGSTNTASTGSGHSSATHAPAGPTATRAPTATPTPSFAHFGDGTFQVGKDIQPGTYRTRTGSPGCYWARLKGFGGTVDDIIANDNTDAPAIVTVAASDKGFQSQNCGTWTQNMSQITTSKTSFGDGTYIVGTDLTPGTYKSTGGDTCYYARLSGFGGTIDDIIANDNVTTSTIVTISSSDKGFQSNGCGTWTKQ